MALPSLYTVDRVMQVLFLLAEGDPLTAREVAGRLGIPVSTCYRYLTSLLATAMAAEVPGSRFTLGPRCVQLEAAYRKVTEVSTFHPIMQEIAERAGETVALLVPTESEAICIDTIESDYPLRYTFTKGVAKPMLRGASAKAMLPYLPPERVEDLISGSAELDAEGKDRLRAELPIIRSQGYVVTIGEVDRGVWAVGAPVLKTNGRLEASLSIIAPLFRVRGLENRLIELTVDAAKRMSSLTALEVHHAP